MKKLLATLPAWLLVGSILVLGSGCTWGGCWTPAPPPVYHCINPCGTPCGDPCAASPTVNINQANLGHGYNRTNMADTQVKYNGLTGWYGTGADIDVNQANCGDGYDRYNLAYTTVEYAGGSSYAGYMGNEFDINQLNEGHGYNRDNVAFTTWTW